MRKSSRNENKKKYGKTGYTVSHFFDKGGFQCIFNWPDFERFPSNCKWKPVGLGLGWSDFWDVSWFNLSFDALHIFTLETFFAS